MARSDQPISSASLACDGLAEACPHIMYAAIRAKTAHASVVKHREMVAQRFRVSVAKEQRDE
jgi:hypothetical protein